ncbi:MAG: hypothetical protein JWN56_2462 [Sphingobacteriales bacterium]|nr:hypothetical protein [Sphingobacteriales bacterium]
MKSLQKHSTRNAFFILLVGFGMLTITSCLKNNDTSVFSAVSLVHASPGLQGIDFFYNGSRVNGDTAINYMDTIPYQIINSGISAVAIKRYISSVTYMNQNINFEGGKYYSLFIIGKPDSVSWLLTQDNSDAPASGKAKLRFLNLSPDAPSLDFKLNGTNTLFTNQAYKTYTDYKSVDPADYTIGIYESGKTSALSQQTLKIVAGRSYTVWAKGLISTPVDSLKLGTQVFTD